MVNAIHSHNAPAVDSIEAIGWLAELPDVLPAAEYRKFLLEKIKTAVIEAWRNRKPGGIARALGFARVGHCRRAVMPAYHGNVRPYRPGKTLWAWRAAKIPVSICLFTFDESHKPTGVVLNLACPSK